MMRQSKLDWLASNVMRAMHNYIAKHLNQAGKYNQHG
jgi:hypothetical protein